MAIPSYITKSYISRNSVKKIPHSTIICFACRQAYLTTPQHKNTHTHHINNLEKLFNLLLWCLYYNVLLCPRIIHTPGSVQRLLRTGTIYDAIIGVYSSSKRLSPFHIIAHQSTHDKALSLSSCFMLLYQKGNIFITWHYLHKRLMNKKI